MTDIAISVQNLSKCFQIYENPRDRLKQFVLPRMQRYAGKTPKQYFNEFWALRDVSFEIKKGESVGIIGRNGSGKSTLLQMICGTLAPTSGDIQTSGRIAALLELGSGFNPEFTGRENVYMNGAVLGLSIEEIDARFDDIAAFAEIGDFIEQPVKTYSSGMMVRLAFAVAISVDPEILIVDEALSVGDELFQRKCFSRIEAIRAGGSTILFVSHSASQIVELCDQVILMDRGEKLIVGTPKKVVGFYQKLLYASALRAKEIRDEIYNEGQGLIVLAASDSNTLHTKFIKNNSRSEISESFDESLTPTSTIKYEPLGAYIDLPSIQNLEKRQVNNLMRGETYDYVYTVTFTQSTNNVHFAMLIKTTSGLELGGGVTACSPRESIPFVNAGSVYRVRFRFRCSLNPGVYFLNCGVVGDVNGTQTYLHRLIDISMFRVLPISGNLITAIIDFGCDPEIECLK
jgi:lipopolysaccharide transport system ATP-binding protein